MQPGLIKYFLFPHTTISQRELCQLPVFFPHLSLLQITHPAALPAWALQTFSGWPVFEAQESIERIKSSIKNYREFADVHGEEGTLASSYLQWSEKESLESRFKIQEQLRGTAPAAVGGDEWSLIQDAVFLEMAKDLDERGEDLQKDLVRIGTLDDQFREILGIHPEQEDDESQDVTTFRLFPDQNHLSFMLRTRMVTWLRLFFRRPPADPIVLVTAVSEAVEEFIEVMTRGGKERAESSAPVPIHLASFPRLDGLAPQVFQELIQEPRSSDLLELYWREMETFLTGPATPSTVKDFQQAAEPLCSHLQNHCKEQGILAPGQMDLHGYFFEPFTLADLWGILDQERFRDFDASSHLRQSAIILLCS